MKRLTSGNYYSAEANAKYMSVSQFKAFKKCPAKAMAEIKGEWNPGKSEALLLGSYVDERLTGTKASFSKFVDEHWDEIYTKKGELRADFAKAEDTVMWILDKQPLMRKYLGGRHQKIMTGEIAGVPFKIRMDSYKKGQFIADLKYMKSLRAPNLFNNLIEYWGYDIQAAVYREIVKQNTGEDLPFYFVIATKETPAHVEVCSISPEKMDEVLEEVKRLAPIFQKIKNGEIPPERCNEYDCDYCTTTKVITEPIDYELLAMSTKQIKAMRGDI